MEFKMNQIMQSIQGSVPVLNPFLYMTDFYKLSHIKFETDGVSEIYSNATARFDHYMREMLGSSYNGNFVVFGVQYMIQRLHYMAQKGFFERDKVEVINEMRETFQHTIGEIDLSHFEALHDLGYLPIEIKALAEGTVAPIGTPFFTIRNTHEHFEWLPNYLETGMSTEVWKPITVATIARCIRITTNKFAEETTGSIEGTEWQNHDFHVRGASGFESAGICGAAFLTSSCGTDNLASLWAAKKFYSTDVSDGLLAGSVPAGEHSVTTSGILTEIARSNATDLIDAEYLYARSVMVDKFPTGIVSYVADSFDYWTFVTHILPQLKNEVMSRDGKFVVRGDSGNPVHIIAGYEITVVDQVEMNDYNDDWDEYWNALQAYLYDGSTEVYNFGGKFYKVDMDECTYEEIKSYEAHGTIECLWDIFGGTVNDLGYRVLDSHIGMIYGDGITPQRQKEILQRLKAKKLASLNVVFGVGSYTLNLVSRDHLGIAIKATNQIVDVHGENLDQPIYKDPKTDSSKKSKRGLLSVVLDNVGNLVTKELQTRLEERLGLLETVYLDGEITVYYNLFEIRDRIWGKYLN